MICDVLIHHKFTDSFAFGVSTIAQIGTRAIFATLLMMQSQESVNPWCILSTLTHHNQLIIHQR